MNESYVPDSGPGVNLLTSPVGRAGASLPISLASVCAVASVTSPPPDSGPKIA